MINKRFSIGKDEYQMDKFGVIHHLNPEPYTYDEKYSSTYDTDEYRKGNDILQALRIGMMSGVMGDVKQYKHLDMGCGNGAFLRALNSPYGYGHDISDHKVQGVFKVSWHAVTSHTWYSVSFWDCLEHLPDIEYTVKSINAHYVFISLPWMHTEMPVEWFANEYPHRKPGEHLHHFDDFALENYMDYLGYQMICRSNLEDRVRKSKHGMANILTAAFIRK